MFGTGFGCVLVWSAIAKYHVDWVTCQKQKIIYLSFGGYKAKIIVAAWSGSSESLILGCRQITSPIPRRHKEKISKFSHPNKGTNPIQGSSTLVTSSNPNYLPKSPHFNIIISGSRVSIYAFWKDTNITG